MGSWDSYCAFCSGPLSSGIVKLGKKDKKALAKRRRVIKKVQKRLAEMDPEVDRVSYSDSEYDHKNDVDGCKEKGSYDPGKVNSRNLAWMDACRALTFNADAKGITKAYITGRGHETEFGRFSITTPGDDPNDSGLDEVCLYDTDDENVGPAIPFHEVCYQIFARSLGYEDAKEIDKDVLYGVMNRKIIGSRLDLSYGDIEGPCQYWDSRSGFEVCIMSCSQYRH